LKSIHLRRLSPVRLALIPVLIALVGLAAAVTPAVWVYSTSQDSIYDDPSQIPTMPVAIVFGAGLQADGTPSPMLADRVDAAIELYKAGKVGRLLMSGDNSEVGYSEVAAMQGRAISEGVPPSLVNLDYAGLRTYDSCYRAAAIFGIHRATLVTQRYHLPRALFLARSFGIDAVGLVAGQVEYNNQLYFDLRELAAQSVAWYEVNVTHPVPRHIGNRIDLEHQQDQ
jgi:vancomycin permeability regulator SanA